MISASIRSERGSATVQALVFVMVLTVVAVACATVGGLLVGHRRAAAAADLAALAAAEAAGGGGHAATAACGQARRVSSANRARLTTCRVHGDEVTVQVKVEVRTLFGVPLGVPGRARAGPTRAAPGSRSG